MQFTTSRARYDINRGAAAATKTVERYKKKNFKKTDGGKQFNKPL